MIRPVLYYRTNGLRMRLPLHDNNPVCSHCHLRAPPYVAVHEPVLPFLRPRNVASVAPADQHKDRVGGSCGGDDSADVTDTLPTVPTAQSNW